MPIAPVRVGDKVDVLSVATPQRRGVEIRRFRLVVSTGSGERGPHGPVFASAKAAIARVSDAVRSCALSGAPRTVELQVLASAGGGWETVEVWGPDVIGRIGAQSVRPDLQQQSVNLPPAVTRLRGLVVLHTPLAPPAVDWPGPEPRSGADNPPRPRTSADARQPKRQRWWLMGTAGLLMIVWSALLYWMTGGEIGALWKGPTATAAITEELRWAREGGAHELAAPAMKRLSAERSRLHSDN